MQVLYFSSLGTCVRGDIAVHITSGALWKALPETVTYESTIPLTYQMEWSNMGLWKDQNSEIAGAYCIGKSNYICEIGRSIAGLHKALDDSFHHVRDSFDITHLVSVSDEEIEDLPEPNIDNVDNYFQSFQNKSRDKRALTFVAEGLSWCCGVATNQHFEALATDNDVVKKQLLKLSQGFQKTLQHVTTDSVNFKAYSDKVGQSFREVKTHMDDIANYTSRAFNNVRNQQVENGRELVLHLNFIYQNLVRTVGLTSVVRDMDIMNACKRRHVPLAIVHPQVLKEDLKKLQVELLLAGQKLAIPIKLIARYYQLPICDCTFSTSTPMTITVQVKVPIVSRDSRWGLSELISTPLKWGHQTCTIIHETMFLAVSRSKRDGSLDMRPVMGANLHQCKPFED